LPAAYRSSFAAVRVEGIRGAVSVTSIIRQKRALCHRPVPILQLLGHDPGRSVAAAVTGLLVGVLGWGTALFVQSVVDHTRDLARLYAFAGAVAAILVFRGAFSLIRRSLQVRLARDIETRLSDRYLEHVTRLEMRFYEQYHTGDLINRLRGVEVLRNAFEDRFLGVTFDAVLVLIAAAVMVRYSLLLSILATIGAAVPGIIIVVIRNSIKQSFEDLRHLDGELHHRLMDALIGIRDMRLTEGEGWILEGIRTAHRNFQDRRVAHIMKLTLLSAVTILLSTLTGIAILVTGAKLVARGSLTQGELMFVFTMAGTMLGPLEQLASTWISFDEASVAYERYSEILALPAEPREPSRARSDIRGAVALEHVTFGYRAGRPILNDVSLEIDAGSSLSIVGESGAGKSTLLSLLCGLHQPDAGRVLIDHRDLRMIGLGRVRDAIGVVFQNPHLFGGTLEENIRMGAWSASDEEVHRAAALAHAADFISNLPDGYKTAVSRAGGNFSGGQVQRIAIARALIGNPRILLLDEATGNLDANAEAAIWTTLTENVLRCTRIFVTHRLSSTCQTDRIVVLERGAIAEVGTFDELLRRQGAFFRLWQRQVSARRIG
jgi:ATP-binding cassette subfamily B protein